MAFKSVGCRLLDRSVISSGFLKSFDYIITDCDGVLWVGNKVLPGARETLEHFRNQGKKIIYVTNNSTKSRKEYVKKFEDLGFKAQLDEVFSSSYCAALYLKSLQFQRKAYIISLAGLKDELDAMGIASLPIGPDPIPDDWIGWIKQGISMDPEVGAVVVGFDVHLSYPKLINAATYLSNPDCVYVATNTDEQFPSDGGVTLPGTGALVSAVTTASNRKPVVMGKPSTYMFDCIQLVYPDIKPERCLMIGDRLNTDIIFGRQLLMQTLFVLTGVNTLEDAQSKADSSDPEKLLYVPDFYSPSLKDVFNLLQQSDGC